MHVSRTMPVCLLLIVFVTACTTSGELTQAEVKSLWDPAAAFFDADIRIDTGTRSYRFHADEIRLVSTEQGTELVGCDYWHSSKYTIRFPWEEVSRLWYDEDIVVYVVDGSRLELDAGEWYMEVEEGRVTSLVLLPEESDTTGEHPPGQELRLKVEDISDLELQEKINWIKPTLFALAVAAATLTVLISLVSDSISTNQI